MVWWYVSVLNWPICFLFTIVTPTQYTTRTTQPAFIFSKLTIERLEHGVKYVQSEQWRHQYDANGC